MKYREGGCKYLRDFVFLPFLNVSPTKIEEVIYVQVGY
jgi:hypothetical protein